MSPQAVASILLWLLLLLTARSSLSAAWRHRDGSHLNVLMAVGAVALVIGLNRQPGSILWAVSGLLLLSQPYLSIRLIEEFYDVPNLLKLATIGLVGMAVVASAIWSLLPAETPIVLIGAGALLQAYSGFSFAREARRTKGVTRNRLRAAAAGSWSYCLLLATMVVARIRPDLGWDAGSASTYLTLALAFFYYIAFATPHWLREFWRRSESALYLSTTQEVPAEMRGEQAAEDLNKAIRACVSNTVTLVAIHTDPEPKGPELTVWASSDQSLFGLQVVPAAGLIGHVYRSGAVVSAPTELEPALGDRLRGRGVRVLAAPVQAEKHTWGVVLAVQRRGSLFPQDDLQLMSKLGQYAGTALDHAKLIIDHRDKQKEEAARQMREAELRMGVLLTSIKDYALYVLDEQGHISTWHSGAEHVFGHTNREIRAASATILFGIADTDFRAHLQHARERGHVEFECTCIRRDGSRFAGITVLRPLDEAAAGERPGFAGVTHDVTLHRDLEARMRQSQKLEAIGQLAGGIAHDFNNLLQTIVGNLDFLRTRLTLDAEQEEEYADIANAAERAASLTQQLLAFSQRQMLRPAPINLSVVLADVAPMLGRSLGAPVEIVTDLAHDLVPILGARDQIQDILLNLALNARDAMPDGGTFTIRTSNLRLPAPQRELAAGTYAVLEVSDTGVGMSDETLTHVFEPFFTTKGMASGTGLGLATVYGVVQQMGGAVRVESRLGGGTAFKFFFPEAVAVPEPQWSPQPRPIEPGPKRILVVEDNDAVRALLKRMLEQTGYRVIAADHPARALEQARADADAIHLVITDVVMPGQLGPEFVEAFSEIRPGVPVLYISGYSDSTVAWHGRLPKEGHFLQKPFTASDLIGRVRQILPS